MLTGRRAFDGEDMTDVLGAVVRLEPDWEALPSEVPPPVRTLLQRCLVKDRRQRVADISTALFVLDQAASLAAPAGDATGPPAATHAAVAARRRTAAARTGRSTLVGTTVWFAMRPGPPRVSRLMITPPPAAALSDRQHRSRPGYHAGRFTRHLRRQQWHAALCPCARPARTARSLSGAPHGPFVSPDGLWVGFIDDVTMKRVAITGGRR